MSSPPPSNQPDMAAGGQSQRMMRIMALFDEARQLENHTQRSAFLANACGHDDDLLREVSSLLEQNDRPTPFMTRSAWDSEVGKDALSSALEDQSSHESAVSEDQLPAGTRIGQFHIQRVINRGGMGVVYEAQQHAPRRTVALKVMRGGFWDRAAIRRFREEGEILGRLTHPNIARVFQTGLEIITSPGGINRECLYVAMEYVDGARTLLDFIAHSQFSTRERLELFRSVCAAVQHAHQKGVIHRDLKPANILVDAAGQVKIIDFGVARTTDADVMAATMRTDVGQLIGTLAYMSPEQCAGDPRDVDTRSDVYALGVILYETLTGKPPYETAQRAIPEVTRIIREESPHRPSTIDAGLRGDLETILLKCLEKDRSRRYQTAAELGADIQRYLRQEPITARPPTLFYQVRMAAKRNRWQVISAVSAALLVVAIVIGSGIGWTSVRLHAAKVRADALAYNGAMNTIEGAILRNDAQTGSHVLRQFDVDSGAWELRHLATRVDVSLDTISRPDWVEHLRQAIPSPTASPASPTAPVLYTASAGDLLVIDLKNGHSIRSVAHDPTHREDDPTPTRLALSADGGTLAWIWAEDQVEIFDTRDPLHPQSRGHFDCTADPATNDLNWVSLNADGTWLAAVESGQYEFETVRLWNIPLCVQNPEQVQAAAVIPAHSWIVKDAKFSPDGRQLATCSYDRMIKVWALEHAGENQLSVALTAVMRGHTDFVNSIAWSPDGRYLVSGGVDMTVRIWDVDESRRRFRDQGDRSVGVCLATLPGHTGPIQAVTWSPDGRLIASGGGDACIRLWRLEPRFPLTAFHSETKPPEPGSWEVVNAEQAGLLRGQGNWIRELEFANDPLTLFSAGSDGAIKIWCAEPTSDPITMAGQEYVGHRSSVFDVAFNPVTGVLASCSGDHTVKLWDCAVAMCAATLWSRIDEVHSVSWSADARLMAAAGRMPLPGSSPVEIPRAGCVEIWSADTRESVATLEIPEGLNRIAFAHVGTRFALGGAQGWIRLCELTEDGRIVEITSWRAHKDQVSGLAFSPDDAWLYSCAGSRETMGADLPHEARIWDLRQDPAVAVAEIPSEHDSLVSLDLSPDGRTLALGSWRGDIDIWDVSRPVAPRRAERLQGHSGAVTALAFHPREARLASGSADLAVKVWDTSSWLEAVTLHGHLGPVLGLAWNNDGSTLASASGGLDGRDNSVRLWETLRMNAQVTERAHSLRLRRIALANLGFANLYLPSSEYSVKSASKLVDILPALALEPEIESAARSLIQARGDLPQ